MNVFFPIAAAILQAASFTLDKVALSIKRVGFKNYAAVSFPLIFLISLVLFAIVRPPLSSEMLGGIIPLLLAISAGIVIAVNLLFYRALDGDNLSELETLVLLEKIPIILAASLLFADERNFTVLIPALIASLAVVWSHFERHHFVMVRKTAAYFIPALLLAPVEASIAKIILETWHPISFEVVRGGLVAGVMSILYMRHIDRTPQGAFFPLLITNILTTIAWILFYYSYKTSGIVYTALLFSLQPLLVYFSSVFFLKEKFHAKKFAAFLVVLAAIAYAQISS